MTISRRYTLIVPRLDRTGPSNVAVDIGRAAAARGWSVALYYLSGTPTRDDLQSFDEVRRFRFSDIFRLQGVVHTHCLRPDLVGWLITWNSRCEVLTTLHNYFQIDLGFDHARWKVRFSWGLWSRAISRMQHRVCISRAMLRYYKRLLPEQKFEVAYNFRHAGAGADVQAPEELAQWLETQSAAGRVRLVYVGGLNPRKNLLSLVEAIAAAPDLSLVLCGQGPHRQALMDLVSYRNMEDRVHFAGQVLHPEAIVERCDLLVLPSFAEGLPLAAIEALRSGRKCLLSNIAVHRELAAMGAGQTFDHRRFTDFRDRAVAMAHSSTAEARQQTLELWRRQFSATAGFARYEAILNNASSGE